MPQGQTNKNQNTWPPRNGNKLTLELMINCTKSNQDDAGQTLHDQFQDDCQNGLCSFCHLAAVPPVTKP